MDINSLVENGHKLVDALGAKGVRIDGALWVNTPDTGSWKLWLVPKNIGDKREFYRKVAEVISDSANDINSIDAGDTELVSVDHPAVKGLRSMMRVDGGGSVHMSQNMLNGFYLPDGIILKMAF